MKTELKPQLTCRHCGGPIKLSDYKRAAPRWTHSDWGLGAICRTQYAEPSPNPEPDLKQLLRTLFPIAWRVDRGRDNMALTLAYAETVQVLGITADELKGME